MVSRVKIPKGTKLPKKPAGTKFVRDAKAAAGRGSKALEQFVRGLRQKPGGTKPKPKAVPKGTKTGPAVKGEMSTRPKKPDYRPKGVRPKVRVLADVKGIRDPKRPQKKRKPIDPKALPGGGTTVNPGRPTRRPPKPEVNPGTAPKRPVGRKPSKRPTPSRPTRGPIRPSMPLPGAGPRPKPKRPTRKPPTRRPSRRPRGMMDAIRRGMRGRRRGSQR